MLTHSFIARSPSPFLFFSDTSHTSYPCRAVLSTFDLYNCLLICFVILVLHINEFNFLIATLPFATLFVISSVLPLHSLIFLFLNVRTTGMVLPLIHPPLLKFQPHLPRPYTLFCQSLSRAPNLYTLHAATATYIRCRTHPQQK